MNEGSCSHFLRLIIGTLPISMSVSEEGWAWSFTRSNCRNFWADS